MNVSVCICVYMCETVVVGVLYECVTAYLCVYVWFETVVVGVLYEHVSGYLYVCTHGCETVDVLYAQVSVYICVYMAVRL